MRTSDRIPAFIGVIGASKCSARVRAEAREVGCRIGEAGAILVCGGLSGVMAAACQGAQGAGGVTVGLLPGKDPRAANRYVSIPIATGLGYARNYAIVNTADVLIAIDGGHGTLSEIGFALRANKPVIGLATWDIEGIVVAASPEQAVELALRARVRR